jgi:hypothetical protein
MLILKACSRIGILLNQFLAENDLSSFKQFSYLCAMGMTMYVGYPEIYQPLIDIIEVIDEGGGLLKEFNLTIF